MSSFNGGALRAAALGLLILGSGATHATPEAGRFPDLPLPPEVTGLAGLDRLVPGGRARYLPLLTAEAKARGLPPEVADAVAHVESSYNSAAVGGDGERGMMQVMPPTAAMLGFRGSLPELAEPETNIRLGVTYLAEAWRLANGDLCRALMKYRAGHGAERMSALSIEYRRRAKSHLAALGSSLGDGAVAAVSIAPAPTQTSAARPVGLRVSRQLEIRRVAGRLVRVAPVRTAYTSRRFWAAHNARIRAIEAKLSPHSRSILVRAL